jgi:hypothetical protein
LLPSVAFSIANINILHHTWPIFATLPVNAVLFKQVVRIFLISTDQQVRKLNYLFAGDKERHVI